MNLGIPLATTRKKPTKPVRAQPVMCLAFDGMIRNPLLVAIGNYSGFLTMKNEFQSLVEGASQHRQLGRFF